LQYPQPEQTAPRKLAARITRQAARRPRPDEVGAMRKGSLDRHAPYVLAAFGRPPRKNEVDVSKP